MNEHPPVRAEYLRHLTPPDRPSTGAALAVDEPLVKPDMASKRVDFGRIDYDLGTGCPLAAERFIATQLPADGSRLLGWAGNRRIASESGDLPWHVAQKAM